MQNSYLSWQLIKLNEFSVDYVENKNKNQPTPYSNLPLAV